MQTVNIHHAKTHLSRLVDEVAGGREIVIARAGKPVARRVPLAAVLPRTRFGLLKGRIRIRARLAVGDLHAPDGAGSDP